MTINLAHLTSNWKSTLQSILTTTFALTGALMASSVISPKTAAIMASINGICKIVLGIFQTDGVQIPTGSKVTQTTETVVSAPKQ
jgi:hypothetical protein